MIRVIKFTAIISVLALLAGCASSSYNSTTDAYKGYSAEQLYSYGKSAVANKKYDQAVKYFEALDALYPFGAYAQRGQLDVIYAYYKDSDLDSTIAAATRYIHLYPRSANVDYAYYLRGMANFRQNVTWLSKVYFKDPALRDLTSMRQAFVDFSELVTSYPNSKYVPDARRRMIYIRNLLARYELSVAKFYMKRKAYVAAANRASQVVDHYQGTPQVIDALKIMVKAYNALGAYKQANQALQVLRTNYPNA